MAQKVTDHFGYLDENLSPRTFQSGHTVDVVEVDGNRNVKKESYASGLVYRPGFESQPHRLCSVYS